GAAHLLHAATETMAHAMRRKTAALRYFSPLYVRYGSKVTDQSRQRLRPISASLIGRLGQALSGYPPLQCRCRSRARASLRNRHHGPSIMGFEDQVAQSLPRPCRKINGRPKRTYELTSSIVPRGTSFHR